MRSVSGGRSQGGVASRVRTAIVIGIGAFGVVAALFAGGIADARGGGPFEGLFNLFAPPAPPPPVAAVTAPPASDFTSRPRSIRHNSAPKKPAVASSSVCVRLCDGFFFPNVYLTGGDAACAAQCPDAPTALYLRPAGSDDIGAAISLRGTPYSALPVANRAQTTYDETCTCHRAGKHSYVAELMHDHTLRAGDIVVTGKGVEVFEGDKSGGVAPRDFVTLAHASNVSRDWRAELAAIDRAGAWNRESGPYSSYNASIVRPSPSATRATSSSTTNRWPRASRALDKRPPLVQPEFAVDRPEFRRLDQAGNGRPRPNAARRRAPASKNPEICAVPENADADHAAARGNSAASRENPADDKKCWRWSARILRAGEQSPMQPWPLSLKRRSGTKFASPAMPASEKSENCFMISICYHSYQASANFSENPP